MTSRQRTSPIAWVLLAVAALLHPMGCAWRRPTVAIVKGKDVDTMVAEAIGLLGGMEQFVQDGQKVVIKPNLVHQPSRWRYEQTGKGKEVREEFTTDIRIVESLARRIREAARCTITIAEGTPDKATTLFKFLGYDTMAGRLGIDLVDVDEGERTAVAVDGLARKEYSLPVVTQTSDVLIDVPAMKTHHRTGVTLGMKNLFGLLPMPKEEFHGQLDEVICDLSLARKPDLVIVDGLVAMEGQGPLYGSPVAMDILVAGRDVVAVDAVCTAIMGFEPRRVRHLKLAHEKGLGEIDLRKIRIKGLRIEDVRRPFEHAMADAEVRLEKTDAMVGKLAEMAQGVERKWAGADLVLTFREGLKVDRARYPDRQAHGFRVHVPRRGNEIVFYVPYKVLYDENRQAAVDEMSQWIEENLGIVVKKPEAPAEQPR